MTGEVLPALYAVSELPVGVPSCGTLSAEDGTPVQEKGMQADLASPAAEADLDYADEGADRDLWMYRDRTVALLKRYARLAVETGRLPSLLGREFFRAKITSYHMATFEDTVIFVHDVEMSLEKLGWFEKKLIAMVVLEEFSQEEAAQLLQCSARTVGRYIYEALDRLSAIFLRGSILKPIPPRVPNREMACQGGKNDQFPVSDSKEAKNNFQNLSDSPC